MSESFSGGLENADPGIAAGFTHALLLREGEVVAAGPIGEALREDTLGATFGLPVRLATEDGRWRAWART